MDDDFFAFPSIDLKQVEASFGVNSDEDDRSDDEAVDKLIQRKKHKPLGRYATAPAQMQNTQSATRLGGSKASAPLETISSESEDDVEAILRKTASQGYVPSDPMMTAGAMDSVRRHQEAMFNLKRKLSAPAVVPAERVMVAYDDDDVQIVAAKRPKLPGENSTDANDGGATGEAICIKVRLDNETTKVKCRTTTKMEKILEHFCSLRRLDPSKVRLWFDGLQLQPSQTPSGLDMEDDDMLDASTIGNAALPATAPTPPSTSAASLPLSSSSSRPASPSAVALIIKIRLNDEQPTRVKVLKSTTFDRILAGFCKQKGLDPSHIRLYFDGLEVGRQQTPEQLDVEADDLFQATSISMPKAPLVSSSVPLPTPATIPATVPAVAAQRPTERRVRAAIVDRAPPANFHLHYPPPPTPLTAAPAPGTVTSRPSRGSGRRKQAAQVPAVPPPVVAPVAVQTIVLTIQDELGALLKIKAFTNTPFSTIFGAWCKQKNRVLSDIQFVANSRTLESHRCPGDYGLSEQDAIVVKPKR
eukprot:GILJ01011319.1.p1 GENE.GILJ01011319.1~~GILJ01011319.1.p1  ORF type:complete len:529 (-),score=77.10 GILJ01011319.1:50-1636(-)